MFGYICILMDIKCVKGKNTIILTRPCVYSYLLSFTIYMYAYILSCWYFAGDRYWFCDVGPDTLNTFCIRNIQEISIFLRNFCFNNLKIPRPCFRWVSLISILKLSVPLWFTVPDGRAFPITDLFYSRFLYLQYLPINKKKLYWLAIC